MVQQSGALCTAPFRVVLSPDPYRDPDERACRPEFPAQSFRHGLNGVLRPSVEVAHAGGLDAVSGHAEIKRERTVREETEYTELQ